MSRRKPTRTNRKKAANPVAQHPPNERMLEAIRKAQQVGDSEQLTSGEDTLRLIREARGGAMWGEV